MATNDNLNLNRMKISAPKTTSPSNLSQRRRSFAKDARSESDSRLEENPISEAV
jgi:hypothetical protein